jgi:hypothetical protein
MPLPLPKDPLPANVDRDVRDSVRLVEASELLPP